MRVMVVLDMLHGRSQRDLEKFISRALPYETVKSVTIINDDRIEKVKSILSFIGGEDGRR